MITHICADFETRSKVDLKTAGPWKYAADPSTDIICLSVKLDDQPSRTWVPEWVSKKLNGMKGLISDRELSEKIQTAESYSAFNAEFERAIWYHIMHKRYGFPDLDLNKMQCSAAAAAYMNLPRKLEKVCEVLNLPVQKDDAGHRLMLKMCKPRNPTKKEKADNPNWSNMTFWHEKSEDIIRLIQYCNTDTDAEYGVSQVVMPLSSLERPVWFLDQRINQRGVHIDLDNVKAIVGTLATHESKLLARMFKLTDETVKSPRQTDKLKEWLKTKGVFINDVQKQTIAELLDRKGLSDEVKEVLQIRQALGKASTSKFGAMLNRVQEDQRCRALFMYSGAGTHRFTAKAIQPQNMVRDSYSGKKLEDVYEAFRQGDIKWIKWAFDDPFPAASRCLRGAIMAVPGKRLVCADYSSIEGRGNAWQAGDEEKMDMFRREDNKTGPKIYNIAAASIFGIDPYKITKEMPEYLVGKVEELARGYQGGIGAGASMAKNYNLNLEILPPLVLPLATPEELNGPYGARSLAEKYLKKNPGSMSMNAAIACDILKRKWRAKNMPIVRSWKQLENAAKMAVTNPGETFTFRKTAYKTWVDPNKNRYLLCQLPSGRVLFYFNPQIRMVKDDFLDDDADVEEMRPGSIVVKAVKYREVITCNVVDSVTKQWVRRPLYGGLLCENNIQSFCRDLLVEAMLRVEAAGYSVVMHVHDEILSEVDKGFGSLEEFIKIMEIVPAWATNMPIKAAGWEGMRFRK